MSAAVSPAERCCGESVREHSGRQLLRRAGLPPEPGGVLVRMVVIPLMSGWIYATWDGEFLRMIYPLIIHLPLILLMSSLTQKAMVVSGFRPDRLPLLPAPALACAVCGDASLRRPCDAECGGACRHAAAACPCCCGLPHRPSEAGGSPHQTEAGIRRDPNGVLCV